MTRVHLCLAAGLFAPALVTAQTPASWTEPIAPFAIADDVYYVGTAGLSAFLFASDDGHILIDGPMRVNTPRVLASIRALGLRPEDIDVHLASHAHFDHVGGLASLMRATGGSLAISERDAEFVRRGDDFGLDTEGYPPVEPGHLLVDGEKVLLGRHTLEALVTPGHTPGCTTWAGEVTIAGDAYTFVVVCSLSALDAYQLVGDDATYPGHGADFCRSLRRLQAIEPDIFLSNHPGFFGMSEKLAALRAGDATAFVESERYRAFLFGAEQAIEGALAGQGHTGGCDALIG